METETKKLVSRCMVYLGKRVTRDDGKPVPHWFMLPEANWTFDRAEDAASIGIDPSGPAVKSWGAKQMAKGMIGGVYQFNFNAPEEPGALPTLCHIESKQWLFAWPHHEEVMTWKAFDTAAAAFVDAQETDQLAEALKPLRLAYAKTIGRKRKAALLAAIINYVTN